MPTRPTAALVVALVAVAAFFALPLVPRTAAATPVASADDCVLPDDGSMGRIDLDLFRRATGVVHGVMLFVDFPDVPAQQPADGLFEQLGVPTAESWLARSSYGKLSLDIQPLRHWLRMPEPLSAYKLVNGVLQVDAAKRYIAEAVALADPEVDFSGVQVVEIVPNPEATAYPRSSAGIYNPDEGPMADGHVLRAVVTLGTAVYARGARAIAHETSHLFGPRDYYNTTGSPTDKFAGAWSLMADSQRGGDHFAFDKWRMGWLTDAQVQCVTAAGRASYVISPLETTGGVKAVILRTGLRTAVVAEYRTRQGVDGSICSTGVLIYKVNSGLGGGAGPVRVSDARPRSARSGGSCSAELDDAAYKAGRKWSDSSSGIEIDVTYVGSAARITVVRTKSYTPPPRYAATITSNAVVNPDGTVTVAAALSSTPPLAACTAARALTLEQLNGGEWWELRTANTDAASNWTYTFSPVPGATYRLLAPERYSTTYDCPETSNMPFTTG
jgi:M6 family metalloprotease-like protein